MPRKRTALFLLIVLAVALLLGVTFVALPRSEPMLPGGAKRIASTAAWQSNSQWAASGATYLWLSPHEVLFLDATAPGIQPVRLDTRTGVRAPVPVARNTIALVSRDWATIRLSPDNRFLLWTDWTHLPARPVAIDLRAPGRTIRWPPQPDYFPNPQWLPDGRRWVGVANRARGGPRALLFSVDRPHDARLIPLPPALGAGYPHLVGLDPRGLPVVVTGSPWTHSAAPLTLTALPLDGSSAGVPSPMRAPIAGLDWVWPSPNGERLLWRENLIVPTPARPINWLRVRIGRLFPRYYRPARTHRLWTSHADGTNLRPLARYETDVENLQWTPNGKSVSFLHNGALWLLPAP